MPLLSEIAKLIGTNLSNGAQPAHHRRGVAEDATPSDISVLSADSYLKQFGATRASAVIVAKKVKLPAARKPAVLIVDDADLALSRVLELFAPPVPRPQSGVHPTATVANDAVIAPSAAIGPHVVVGHRSHVGARSVIHPGVVISDDVVLGQDCEIFPNVVIRERITIGDRVIIHAGSVLGTDGFGYRWDGSRHAKVPQIGMIVIEDDVEIGSCVCIDRAKMGVTRIGRGTKIDNLVQIAHNCDVGPHCIIVGQVGLAGSVELGAGVVLGGQTAVRDHVTMGDGAMAAARSAVHEDVDAKSVVSGMPALPHRQSLREQAALRRLPDLVTQVRKLTEEIEKLKAKLDQRMPQTRRGCAQRALRRATFLRAPWYVFGSAAPRAARQIEDAQAVGLRLLSAFVLVSHLSSLVSHVPSLVSHLLFLISHSIGPRRVDQLEILIQHPLLHDPAFAKPYPVPARRLLARLWLWPFRMLRAPTRRALRGSGVAPARTDG